ncbi:hypothetical protein ACTMTF_47550 [Nonomuraea sp. ZG12]|uniref:hypothetical protein n=1 Tax=Nonomuraea sp. ZG12 TaxID=3452207 RepID=UPI003F8A3637
MEIKPGTLEDYRIGIRLYVKPYIGKMRLQAVRPLHDHQAVPRPPGQRQQERQAAQGLHRHPHPRDPPPCPPATPYSSTSSSAAPPWRRPSAHAPTPKTWSDLDGRPAPEVPQHGPHTPPLRLLSPGRLHRRKAW